jgi:hypothetical protein
MAGPNTHDGTFIHLQGLTSARPGRPGFLSFVVAVELVERRGLTARLGRDAKQAGRDGNVRGREVVRDLLSFRLRN